ncbi:MAG: hypothetical protein ACYSW3_10300 [Planctomycetota bacterium]|jgi:hypothetical protein
MSGDINNQKEEVEKLNRLGWLLDRYAQSRAFGLWVSVAVGLINVILLLGSIQLCVVLVCRRSWWWWAPLVGAGLWGLISTVWLWRFDRKHGHRFYDKKDGKIEVERERIPAWAWAAYGITFMAPLILNACEILSDRWGLTMSLISFGVFMLYACKKEKEKFVGVVLGGLCLIEAAATALGVPVPLTDIPLGSTGISAHSYFLALTIYITAAGLIAMVVVHIYNRRILHKIKEVRPFGEQQANKPDS